MSSTKSVRVGQVLRITPWWSVKPTNEPQKFEVVVVQVAQSKAMLITLDKYNRWRDETVPVDWHGDTPVVYLRDLLDTYEIHTVEVV